ncbi:hypothetical protein [Plebeiibacterium marinum]|uniref:Uncharacterized protein n=1 Tax=Plebeiibacterium marinum TaxID=2992111 RepID=A0AAE3MBT1_9BACT|nr:hypothetical protein [Plebeiobacterium marinum]MCW3804659.1 hypothetical protein [Plebeiobacterium marinum]
MNEKIGNISNYLASVILFIFGCLYLFNNTFMSYHGEALHATWNDLDSSVQILILALMRAVGGGFLAVAIVIALLQVKFSLTKISWIPGIIFATGVTIDLTSIYATLILRTHSTAKPPTFLALLGLCVLLIGYIYNRKTLKCL